jgi:multicomponent Na+:H+ antiporter subunit A
LATAQTALLQSGYLRYYLITVLATMVGLGTYALLALVEAKLRLAWEESYFYEVALAGLLLIAAVATVRAQRRLAAVAALGVVGYGAAMVFILFGAPDLAMTQFAIETLTVILLVLVLYRLPRFAVLSNRLARLRDLLVALASGALITALALMTTRCIDREPVSGYFVEHSVAEAHGRNIVNVILVDFRGFDTLGEITVLAVAAIGVYGLLKLRIGEKEQAP